MEGFLQQVVRFVASIVEIGAAFLIVVGACETFYRLFVQTRFRVFSHPEGKRDAWLRFATWLVLALEFELAADVLRTAIAPTWNDVGQLAAIAVIRTFLNYFLEKDIESISEQELRNAQSASVVDHPTRARP